ncbi:MAG: hypothetical protein ACOCWM_04470, partial [Cyclobacteriaceae bacterium]
TKRVPAVEQKQSFMKEMLEILGEPIDIHRRGYLLSQLPDFFNQCENFSKLIVCENDQERSNVNEIFGWISDDLSFNLYLKRKVKHYLKGRFTRNQLACIFQSFNGSFVSFDHQPIELGLKENLLDYIQLEGKSVQLVHEAVDGIQHPTITVPPGQWIIGSTATQLYHSNYRD